MPVQPGRLALPYPASTAAADVPADIQAICAALETAAPTIYRQGTAAARGAAGTAGKWYFATDTGVLSYDNGTTWVDVVGGGSSVPIGATMGWPWRSADVPAGFGLMYGQALLRATYPVLNALAAALTPTPYLPYGAGDGTTTFNVPDQRGLVEVGKSDMGGANAGRLTVAIAGVDGTTLGVIAGAEGATITILQMPAHNHGAGDHTHTGASGDTSAGSHTGRILRFANPVGTTQPVITDASGPIISTQGGGSAHSSMQPFLVVNKIMRIA